MNRWAEANIGTNPDWKVMLGGNPMYSTYLWAAILITITAMLAVVKVASQIYGNQQEIMQWAPILLAVVVVMWITAARAIDAVNNARLETATGQCSAAVEKRAFRKFRAYSLFTVIAAMALIGLSTQL